MALIMKLAISSKQGIRIYAYMHMHMLSKDGLNNFLLVVLPRISHCIII